MNYIRVTYGTNYDLNKSTSIYESQRDHRKTQGSTVQLVRGRRVILKEEKNNAGFPISLAIKYCRHFLYFSQCLLPQIINLLLRMG